MEASTKRRLTDLIFSESLKKWLKGILCVVWVVWPMVFLWSNSTVCTIEKVGLEIEERTMEDRREFPVTTVYKYTHRGQSYDAVITSEFSSPNKREQWITKHPMGSEVGCLVSFFNPEKITIPHWGFPFVVDMLDYVFYPACGLLLFMVFGLVKMYFPFGFTSGPQVHYQKISHPGLEERIRIRYRDDIAQLRKLGFQDFCFYRGVLPKYSAVWSLLEYLEMRWQGEITQIQDPFRVALLYPLLVLPGETTYGTISANDVSFYTRMSHGAGVITRRCRKDNALNFFDLERKLRVRSTRRSIAFTWDYHKEQIEEMRKEGFSVQQDSSFEEFADMAENLNESFWKENRWMEEQVLGVGG